jgi:hypothetical protein
LAILNNSGVDLKSAVARLSDSKSERAKGKNALLKVIDFYLKEAQIETMDKKLGSVWKYETRQFAPVNN